MFIDIHCWMNELVKYKQYHVNEKNNRRGRKEENQISSMQWIGTWVLRSGYLVSSKFKIYPKSNHTSISTVRSIQVTTTSFGALQQLSNWSPGSHFYTKLAKQQSVIFQKYKSRYLTSCSKPTNVIPNL